MNERDYQSTEFKGLSHSLQGDMCVLLFDIPNHSLEIESFLLAVYKNLS